MYRKKKEHTTILKNMILDRLCVNMEVNVSMEIDKSSRWLAEVMNMSTFKIGER